MTSRFSSPAVRRLVGAFIAGAAMSVAFASAARAEAPAFTEEYVAKAAAASGYSEQAIRALLRQAEVQPRIIELMNKPAEKAMTWNTYYTRVITQERIDAGREFMATYADTLAKAEATYGVPKEIISAIIGIETKYGAIKGNYRVLDSLSTLAFGYPRRAAFFQKELTAFLTLAKEGNVDPLTTKGSYAGALGWPQFMPSNVSKLATDFNGDGKIDLVNSPVDAIGSVAKYFSENGWKTGGPVSMALPSAEGSNLEMEGADGPVYFKTEDNFKAIKRYNKSNLYAMAVYLLSEQLRTPAAK